MIVMSVEPALYRACLTSYPLVKMAKRFLPQSVRDQYEDTGEIL